MFFATVTLPVRCWAIDFRGRFSSASEDRFGYWIEGIRTRSIADGSRMSLSMRSLMRGRIVSHSRVMTWSSIEEIWPFAELSVKFRWRTSIGSRTIRSSRGCRSVNVNRASTAVHWLKTKRSNSSGRSSKCISAFTSEWSGRYIFIIISASIPPAWLRPWRQWSGIIHACKRHLRWTTCFEQAKCCVVSCSVESCRMTRTWSGEPLREYVCSDMTILWSSFKRKSRAYVYHCGWGSIRRKSHSYCCIVNRDSPGTWVGSWIHCATRIWAGIVGWSNCLRQARNMRKWVRTWTATTRTRSEMVTRLIPTTCHWCSSREAPADGWS